jgi:hypothetical protein
MDKAAPVFDRASCIGLFHKKGNEQPMAASDPNDQAALGRVGRHPLRTNAIATRFRL